MRGALAMTIVLAASMLALAIPASEKAPEIRGHLVDRDGAALSGVLVKATNDKNHRATTTESNLDGNFELAKLSSGIYDVTFMKDGFEFMVYPHVTVKRGETLKLDVTLHRP